MLYVCEKIYWNERKGRLQKGKLISKIRISVFLFRQVTVPCSLHKWSSFKHIRIPSGVTDWVCICCCCPWLHRHDTEMRTICVCYCETNTELNNDKKSVHLAGLYLMWISTLCDIWGFFNCINTFSWLWQRYVLNKKASFKCLQQCVIIASHKYLCILNLNSVSSTLNWCLQMKVSELTENAEMDTDNMLFNIVYKTWKQSHALSSCSRLRLIRSCVYGCQRLCVQQHVVSIGCQVAGCPPQKASRIHQRLWSLFRRTKYWMKTK